MNRQIPQQKLIFLVAVTINLEQSAEIYVTTATDLCLEADG